MCERLGRKDPRFHPYALVESDDIGHGTRVWAFAHVMPGARIGNDCNIGDHAFVEGGASIGNGVTLKNGVCVWEGVHLGDGVFVGPYAGFTNDRWPRSARNTAVPEVAGRYADKSWLLATQVEEGASIGANATVLCGITIGAYALVAAGAVANRDVAAHSLVAGSPARHIGWVCCCGQRLTRTLDGADDVRWSCELCKRDFSEADGSLKAVGC